MSNPIVVAVKTLKELVRQPRNLALSLGIPVMFMLIFGSVFGKTTTTTYEIGVVNDDAGDLGAKYLEGLDKLHYESGKDLVALKTFASVGAASDALRTRGVDLVVHLPSNFTAGLTPTTTAGGPLPTQPAQRGPPPGSLVETLGDPSSGNSNAAQQVVASYTQSFAEAASGQKPVVRAAPDYITASEVTQFDYIAPGLMVYSVIALAPQAASALARETELKTLDRVRLSPTRSATLLAGVALAELVMAAIAVTLMLLTARLMGYHNQGTYAAAFGICIVAALATVGIGMVIASFARTQQEAANLGIFVTLPLSFLSGAFFPVPAVKLFSWNGHMVELYDLFPTKHAIEAMRQVMTFGTTLTDVVGRLEAMVGLAVALFAVGVILFRRARLTPE